MLEDVVDKIILEENIASNLNNKQSSRTTLADRVSMISYSLIVGTAIDLFSGLNTVSSIASSRFLNTTYAGVTAKYYGQWRDYLYRKTNTTDHNSPFIKKFGVELFSFNSFYAIPYGVIMCVSYMVSEQKLDYDTFNKGFNLALNGMLKTMSLSPLNALVFGYYGNIIRKYFGVKTPGEKVENLQYAKSSSSTRPSANA